MDLTVYTFIADGDYNRLKQNHLRMITDGYQKNSLENNKQTFYMQNKLLINCLNVNERIGIGVNENT